MSIFINNKILSIKLIEVDPDYMVEIKGHDKDRLSQLIQVARASSPFWFMLLAVAIIHFFFWIQ